MKVRGEIKKKKGQKKVMDEKEGGELIEAD